MVVFLSVSICYVWNVVTCKPWSPDDCCHHILYVHGVRVMFCLCLLPYISPTHLAFLEVIMLLDYTKHWRALIGNKPLQWLVFSIETGKFFHLKNIYFRLPCFILELSSERDSFSISLYGEPIHLELWVLLIAKLISTINNIVANRSRLLQWLHYCACGLASQSH